MKKFISKIILKYLQTLTKFYVKRQKVEFIGLTGSVGKTTLTLAVHDVLSKKFKTAMTFQQGHGLNSETGIPFAILGVHVGGYSLLDWARYLAKASWNFFFKKCPYEKFVLEMGVDKPGDMDHLLTLVKPNTGIFLSIAKVHGENFEYLIREEERREGKLLKLIFGEKAKLIKALRANSIAILNYDDPMILGLKDKTDAQVVTFGLLDGADVKGVVKDITENHFQAEIIYQDKKLEFRKGDYLINEKMFMTLLAAFSIGVVYMINPAEIINALENVSLPPGRMTKIYGIKNSLIIDSSYNASKPAMLEALDNLQLFKDRKKIAVLGDMRELGVESKSEHGEVAGKAVKVADEMVLIGPAMRDYFMSEALKLGYSKEKIHCFDNTWKALEFIREELIEGGEVILVKGSQNTLFLEIIVQGLMKDKSKAKDLLCRRGTFWDKKRRRLRDLSRSR